MSEVIKCKRCGGCCTPGFQGFTSRVLIIDHDDQAAIAEFLGVTVEELAEYYRVNTVKQSLDVSHNACPFLIEPKDGSGIHHCRIHKVKPVACGRWPTAGTMADDYQVKTLIGYCAAITRLKGEDNDK